MLLKITVINAVYPANNAQVEVGMWQSLTAAAPTFEGPVTTSQAKLLLLLIKAF